MIDREDVRRAARLAGLELEEDEVRRLAEELRRVLDRFERLPPPAGEPGAGERGVRLRPDVPSSDGMTSGPAREAPDWRDGFFVVPRLPAMDGPGGGSA